MPLDDLLLFALWAVVAVLATFPLRRDNAGPHDSDQRLRFTYELVFFGVVLLGLLACRYPVLVYPRELNIDECQFVAQALGYHRDWMPFTQDGHTCGPLNYYILTWPAFLGLPITYFTIRLTGFVLVLLTLFYARRTAALIAGNRLSYLIALPLISFYFFAYQPGFVHFSSEHFPEALLAFCLWQVAKYWRLGRSNFFLLGTILGAIPFTKLQASPMAVFVFAAATGLLVHYGPRRKEKWTRGLIHLYLGGALVPLVIGVPLAATGALGDALYRYIIVNAAYGAQLWTPDPHPFWVVLYEFARNGPQFTIYFLGQLAVCAGLLSALLVFHEKKFTRRWLVGLVLIVVLLALGCWAVVKPWQPFCHYLLLLPVLVMLLTAWVVRGGVEFCRAQWPKQCRRRIPALFLLLSILCLPLYVFEQHALPYLDAPPLTQFAPISSYIRSVTQKDDTISNWGYTPEYYVETQLPPGVRDYSTLFEIFPDPQYDYFRAGYLEDLKRNRPKVIIDSISQHYLPTWAHPIDQARISAVPEIAAFLAENYASPVAFPSGSDTETAPVLVYVRKP